VAESIPSFERALAIRPDLELTHRNLGLALWSQGRLSEARRHLEEAVRLRPDYYDGHASLAGFLIAAGQPAEARAHGERLVALSPREPAGHVLLAAALAAEGRRSEAEARYREAVAVDGGNVPALLGLAESLATCPRDGAVGEEALSLAERARLTPGTDESARFWAVLARAQAAAGRSVEARRSARRAAAIARRQGNAALVRSLTQPRAFWLHGAPYCSDPPGTPAP
jgi:tetratricopeptide (TPR) repeat protein